MKKLILILAFGLGLTGASAFAHEDDYGDARSDYRRAYHRGGVGYEINHINGMLAHVRREMWRYRASWRIRAEVRHISDEVAHVNAEYRRGDFGSGHIRREIQHIHSELHNVELRLQFRPRDYYRWD